MKRKMKRTVFSLFLTLCLLINVAPITFAEEIHTEEANAATGLEDLLAGVVSVEEFYGSLDSQTVPEIIGYDYAVSKAHVQRLYEKEGNHLDTVIFRNADGTETAYIFDYPVKYVDESGKTKDITLDIADSAVSGEFKTADGSAVTTFSRNLSDGIGLRGNNTSLSLIPHLPTAKAGAALSSTATLTANSTAERIDRKTVSYDYDSKTTIEYSLTYTGFKEDIVVSEYTGQTEYDFTLYTNGLTLTEVDGSFYLVDGNNTVKAALGDIIIFTADEKNNTMGEMTAQTVIENQEYLLTISVDAEYLAAEETVYPIRIDPSVEICYDNDGAGAIQDVTLNSLQGSSGTSGSLMVGLRETYGKSRILMKFPGLDVNALGSNVAITEATVELRDLMCETAGLEVSCYVFTGNVWSESTANWSNVNPDSYSTFLSSQTISYANGIQQSTAHRYAFDITKAVEGWRAGNYNPNKGILFKASSSVEGGTTYKSKTMASYNRSSNKPSLSVTYLTGTNLVSNDTYYLNNQNCGGYLRYTSLGPKAVSGLISSLGNSIRWEIRAISGGYVIRSKSDTTQYLGAHTTKTNKNVAMVTVEDTAIPERCIWKIQISAVGGCLIKSAYNSRYLYSYGDSVYTESTLPGADTPAYSSRVWRIASTSYYGYTSTYDARELTAFSVAEIVVNVANTALPSITIGLEDAIWCEPTDFTYLYASGTTECVTVDEYTTQITGCTIGIAQYKAVHKVTGRTYTFSIYVDRYTYELNIFFGFSDDEALLIRKLYDKIDNIHSSYTVTQRAWITSRVLSEFSYDGIVWNFGFIPYDNWNDVAGSVTEPNNRQEFFIDVLGYTETEYTTINNALTTQHDNANTSDFTHMQYSIAARLAYELNIDRDISNLKGDDETISYLAGWLGDATLLTAFGNDDYMSDLDAENVFREIIEGKDSISAINEYYETLTEDNGNRATIFQSYLNYSTVEEKVEERLGKPIEQIQAERPDTYDFLMSLQNNLSEIAHY